MLILTSILALVWFASMREAVKRADRLRASREPGRKLPLLSQTMNFWRWFVTPIDYRD
jgi:hypothetical protein